MNSKLQESIKLEEELTSSSKCIRKMSEQFSKNY